MSGERQMEESGQGFEIVQNLALPCDLPKYHESDAVRPGGSAARAEMMRMTSS